MKLIQCFILFAFLSSAPLKAEKSDEQQLRYIKEVLWPKIYREQDTAGLEKLLDPSFELVAANGSRTSKADEVASLSSFTWPHDNFKFSITRLDIYKSNFAIVSGEGRASGNNKKGAYCFKYQSSNVLQKVKNEWKAVLSHVSGVKDCE